MISNILINVSDKKYIDDYRKAGVQAFLFALEDFSVGYETFKVEEINNIKVSNKYILINRVLDCDAMDNFKKVLPTLKNIKGIIYEDIGIYNYLKEKKLDIELIFFQNHFATNSISVNYWLDRVDSIMLSNEITEEEIRKIVENSKKKVCISVYGYNQIMYSRRLLLTNWSEEFSISPQSKNIITDIATGVKFRVMENKYGTVMYSEYIFNGQRLLDLKNIKYFYVNTTMIPHSKVMAFLNGKNILNPEEDNGFLDKKTIYKLKEARK